MAGGSRVGFGEVGWLVSDPGLVSRALVAAACRAAARVDSSAEGDNCRQVNHPSVLESDFG